jgi:hypothetical protein
MHSVSAQPEFQLNKQSVAGTDEKGRKLREISPSLALVHAMQDIRSFQSNKEENTPCRDYDKTFAEAAAEAAAVAVAEAAVLVEVASAIRRFLPRKSYNTNSVSHAEPTTEILGCKLIGRSLHSTWNCIVTLFGIVHHSPIYYKVHRHVQITLA